MRTTFIPHPDLMRISSESRRNKYLHDAQFSASCFRDLGCQDHELGGHELGGYVAHSVRPKASTKASTKGRNLSDSQRSIRASGVGTWMRRIPQPGVLNLRLKQWIWSGGVHAVHAAHCFGGPEGMIWRNQE